jgi:23S rRNA pseudouridine2605 synthase
MVMANDDQKKNNGERIAKVIARAGLCSRRDAERWIEAGRVELNGKKLMTPACVVTAQDIIVVDGKALPDKEPTRMWRYNKPAGLVTSHKDPQGRKTVFQALPPFLPRVISVGRLDYNSEGLLLLTNDGELARKLELPDTGWTRRYRVRVHGNVEATELTKLSNGVTVDGVKYGSIIANFDSRTGANAWMTVILKEGKNREIRKVMEHIGLTVNRLIRTAYGPFQIGSLEQRDVDEVRPKSLRDQVGMFLK